MYWKVLDYIDSDGKRWITYNYIEVVPRVPTKEVFHNPVTGVTRYPIKEEVIIKAIETNSEDEFMFIYAHMKGI